MGASKNHRKYVAMYDMYQVRGVQRFTLAWCVFAKIPLSA